MLRRCSNCEHCGLDMRALSMRVYIHKCYKKRHHIFHPFWSGWLCKGWVKEDG
jgi:hypothetical protein